MICVSIFGKDLPEVAARAKGAAKYCDLLELRLDLTDALDKEGVENILKVLPLPVIATNRAAWEGGKFKGPEESRLGLLEDAARLGAAYVDVEFATKTEFRESLRKTAKECGAKVIISHHDFEKTPPFKELEVLYEKMVSAGADVVKIVTLARDKLDFLKVAMLYPLARSRGKGLVAFCMGELGCYSRIFCLELGALFTFASYDEGVSSAPGQVPVEKMAQIVLGLKKGCPDSLT